MLKKFLCIYALAAFSIAGLQATDTTGQDRAITPGVLVCNCSEDKCTKDGERSEDRTPSAGTFVLLNQEADEGDAAGKIIACKDCK